MDGMIVETRKKENKDEEERGVITRILGVLRDHRGCNVVPYLIIIVRIIKDITNTTLLYYSSKWLKFNVSTMCILDNICMGDSKLGVIYTKVRQ